MPLISLNRVGNAFAQNMILPESPRDVQSISGILPCALSSDRTVAWDGRGLLLT